MTEERLPGHEEQPEEITCESCGRFVGALTKCPHCGAKVKARMSIRFFRLAAVLLATLGLLFLYLMATHREVPVIQIGDIKPTMNFGFVRMQGVVSESARIKYEGENIKSVRFMINDGSGEMAVTAFTTKGKELVDSGALPRVGDHVDVSGSLSISAEYTSLMLQSKEQMKLTRGEIVPHKLGEITEEHIHSTAIIVGTITEVRPPRLGKRVPWTIRVEDETGKKDMTFWQDVYDGMPDKLLLAPGQKIRAEVAVGIFRKKIQLMLPEADDMEFLGKDPDYVPPPAE